MSFIFGGGTGLSYDEIKRRQRVAEAMMARGAGPAPNMAAGLANATNSVVGALMDRRARKDEEEGRERASSAFDALFKQKLDSTPETAQPIEVSKVPPPSDDNAGRVHARLTEAGYPPHIAAGLIGNLMQESGPGLDTSAVGDGGNAFGMGQWNGPRMNALMEFAGDRDPAGLDTQIDFLLSELDGPESRAREAIMAAQTPEDAARIASERFWRPGAPMMENRIRFANEAAERFGNVPAQPAAQPQAQPEGSPDRLAQLSQLAGNGFLNDGQRGVVAALMQRELAKLDPEQGMTPYQAASLGLQRDRLNAQLDGRIATQPTVNVNNGDPSWRYGTIPQGFQLSPTPDGGYRMEPIPGGPAAIEEQERAEAQEKNQELKETQADLVDETFQNAVGILQESGNWAAGFGSMLSSVPLTSARELAGALKTIRSNIGFDKLQAMREASPTGGALGQVSNMELQNLQAVLGDLEQDQDPEVLIQNLSRANEVYLDIVHGPGNRPSSTPAAERSDEDILKEYGIE